ncbi:hypothetical protein PQS31_16770 [Luteimonas sp BLCC-B24]|nr:hypothetical protein [Luteimonas sp. BLCC-B24]MDC7808469.1 hypothetical protein [Luteimonas sp. BLCC-B24]
MNDLPAILQLGLLVALIVGGVCAFGGGLILWAHLQNKDRE